MANGNGKKPSEVIKKSVTQADYSPTPQAGYSSVFQLLIPGMTGQQGDLPSYWSPIRDRVLRTTPMRESMWASAVHIAISKVSNRSWKLDGRRVSYWQELINGVDNRQSFVGFMEKLAKDFLLTDNGCFFEIVRANKARGARIIGIQPLASWRCIRTGDIDIPIIYRDRHGTWHEMKDYQVVSLVDEPENAFTYYNIEIGFCAASRAYQAIMKLSALEQYVYEKIAGKRPLSIYLINAQIKEQQLQNAVDVQRERSISQGYVQYMGAVMIPILDPTATPQVAEIKIAGLPDGFDPKEERLQGQLIYADALGLDPTDLNPELAARGRALGSGAQAQVLDDKGKGKGIFSFTNKFTWMLNDRILPPRVMFSTYESDLADELRRAQVRSENLKAARLAVGNGQEPPILTPTQVQNWLNDIGEITSEYVSADLTADEMLHDADKPAVVTTGALKPPDADLMQTKPPEPTTLAPQKVTQKERVIETLLNSAEQWMNQTAKELTPLMTDDELLAAYLKAHPEVWQRLEEKNKRRFKKVANQYLEQERTNAQALYRQFAKIISSP